METDFVTAEPNPQDWLSPTEALTRFRRPEAASANALPSSIEETTLGFRVGSIGFLLTADTFCEVIGLLPVNPLPNTKPWFSGILNLRGNLVPVFDLRGLFGEPLAEAERKKRCLFAIGRGDKTVALWIDGLPEKQSAFLQPLTHIPVLPAVLRHCVSEGYLGQGQVWLKVRFDELFKTLGRQVAAGQGG